MNDHPLQDISHVNLGYFTLDFVFKGHENYVTSVCIKLDGKYLITGSDDKTCTCGRWKMYDLCGCTIM